MPGCAFVDGQYVAPEDAKISIFDWGFLHSDATYDVAHVWQGKFFRLDDHIERFFASMARLRLDPGKTRDEVRAVMHECVRRSGLREAYVEVLCTRPPARARATAQLHEPFHGGLRDPVRVDRRSAEAGARRRPRSSATLQRIAPASVDPRTKNYHWLDAGGRAVPGHEHGAETAVLVDGAGNITEGPGFNVFALVDGELLTPARRRVEGISRRTVIELARQRYYEREALLPVARCGARRGLPQQHRRRRDRHQPRRQRCRWPVCGWRLRPSDAAPAAA